MAEYSAALNPPFTLEQVSDLYKAVFDALGWGTGLPSTPGGYRFTPQMEADTAVAPIRITPDGAIIAPNSIDGFKGNNWIDNGDGTYTAQGMADWVDNFNGKNLCFPPSNHDYRWRLLFYLPGLKRLRITFTIVQRLDSTTTGSFNDIKIDVRESFATNSSRLSSSNRSASIKDPNWGSTYTVGQQYTTLWSHGSGGAIPGMAEAWTYISIGVYNAHLRIDSIEYEVASTRFGVQSPSQDSGLFEFVFTQNPNDIYGVMLPLPVRNPYRPRILLMPPSVNSYQNEFSYPDRQKSLHHFYSLWNAFRDEDLATSVNAGVMGLAAACAVVKGFSFGTTVNVYLASNPDFRGFFLRSTQSGKPDYQVALDQVDRGSYLPETSVTVPESMVRFASAMGGAISEDTNYPTSRTGYLFQVRGTTPRVLDRIAIGNLYYPSGTYVAKLYAVSVQAGPNGNRLIYQGTVATLTLSAISNYAAEATGLGLSLAPGYYLLVLPPNLPIRGVYASFPTMPPGREIRHLGPIACRDPGQDNAWVEGTTQINISSDNLGDWGGNLSLHNNATLNLEFVGCDTPSRAPGAIGEGVALLTGSALDGSFYAEDYERLPTNAGSHNYTSNLGMGAVFPFGLELTVNQFEAPYVRWQLSPLPGYMASFRGNQDNGHPNPTVLEFEFGPGNAPASFEAYADRPYRQTSPRFHTLRVRTGTAVAPGDKYDNGDGTYDVVISVHTYYGNRSTVFRSR